MIPRQARHGTCRSDGAAAQGPRGIGPVLVEFGLRRLVLKRSVFDVILAISALNLHSGAAGRRRWRLRDRFGIDEHPSSSSQSAALPGGRLVFSELCGLWIDGPWSSYRF